VTKVKAQQQQQQQQQQKVDVAGVAAGAAAGADSAAGSKSDIGRSDLMQQLLQLESQVGARTDSPAVPLELSLLTPSQMQVVEFISRSSLSA